MEVRIEVDKLEEVAGRLGTMKNKAPAVIKKAVNETMKQARKLLDEKARESYTVKRPNFQSVMRHESATVGNLMAVIHARSETLPLNRFEFKKGKEETQVRVLKEGAFKTLRDNYGSMAFYGNIAKKGMVRSKDTKKGKAGSAVIHKAIARRKDGAKRLHIEELKGNSLAVMVSGKRTVGKAEPEIRRILEESIEREVRRILDGAGQ